MKLIVGLGNPGREYANTRHNVGWWAVDHLADVWRFDPWRKDHEALIANGRVAGQRVRLMKPQTFMNLSGAALRTYLRREAFDPARDLMIVVDEVALPCGRIRLGERGSAGGHNGLKSIEAAVGSREYPRFRIGVGPPPDRERKAPLTDYVLDRMGKGERALVEGRLPDVAAALECWLGEGIAKAMSVYNGRGTGDGGREKPARDADSSDRG